MKKILLFLLPLFFVILMNQPVYAIEKSKVYSVEIRYMDGAVTIGAIIVKDGFPSIFNDDSLSAGQRYKIELRSFNNGVLEELKFNISTTLMPPPPLEGDAASIAEPIILKETSTVINLPYHRDGNILVLYGPDSKKLDQADIGYLADVCGDSICQPHESFESCPKDCSAGGKDDYCDYKNQAGDPDCKIIDQAINKTDEDAKKSPPSLYYLIIVLSVVSIAAGAAILLIKRRK